MAFTRTPRTGWIDEGLKILAAGGPDAVRIEVLAKALGVSKGGFYWHFADRRALLSEMLDTWERVTIDEVIAQIDSEGGKAHAKLERLFRLASSGDELLQVDLAVRDWARRDARVAARLRRADNRRMDYLRSQFAVFCPDDDDVEVRSLLAMTIWIGNHFIAADHRGRSRRRVLGLAMRRLLEPAE